MNIREESTPLLFFHIFVYYKLEKSKINKIYNGGNKNDY